MRILLGAAIGWMVGILAQGLVGGLAAWWIAGAILALAALARPSLAAVVAAAIALGGAAAATRRDEPAAAPPAGEVLVEGVVARVPEVEPGLRRVLVDLDDRHGGVRVRVTERPAGVALLAGDVVRFRATLREPTGYDVEGAFDRARFLRARGVALEASARGPRGVVAEGGPSWWRAAGWARARAEDALGAASSGDGGALLAALVVGARGGVSDELEDAFRRAGVAHVLSVSGLHLAAAAWLAYALARRLWRTSAFLCARFPAERAAAAVALPAAAAYTFVTGAEVATLRALLCAAVLLGARILGRAGDALTALAVAALLLLVDQPLALYEPSFQLSFAAAAALAVAAARWPSGPGLARRVRSLVIASLCATLATAPLTALHFGEVQPGGIVANLVLVPFAELLVLPLGLLGALLGIITPAAGASFVAVAGLAAEGLVRAVRVVAAFTPSLVVPPPSPVELAAIAAALAAIFGCRWRRALVAGALAAVALLAAEWLAARPPDALVVTFLDVGQGDAALVETPAGERWLVDGGGRLFGEGPDPGAHALRPFLAARRVERLDVVVLSHPHPDHYGGLAALLGRVRVGELWITGDDPGDARWEELAERFRRAGTPVLAVGAGWTRAAGDARLAIVAPPAPDARRSVNDNSLVAAVSFAGRRVLFAGDLEAEGEAALAGVAADVVKVAHHGSRTSSTAAFVDATHPSLAVVSCGRGNRFGFPAPEVVARWLARGARVLRTDERGSITVTVEAGGALHWHTRR